MHKSLCLLFLLIATKTLGQVICIDPGHGYGINGENHDDRTWEEITTNVAVGLYLRDSLEERGYTVIMTRENSDSGSWMSLTQRAEMADYYESERLLSIHCNGGGGTGTETFWSRRNTPNYNIDRIFSDIVQEHMVVTGEWFDRRSAEDITYLGFQLGVLKGYAPGCLNEIGFVDRPEDLEKLLDEEWRQVFAQAYTEAIVESFNRTYPEPVSIVENEVSVTVYPNPFKNVLYIRLSGKEFITTYMLRNISGNILKTGYLKTGQNSIDTNGLLPGYYILILKNGNTNYHNPVIKI